MTQSTPTGPRGVWAKAESSLPAGFAPSPARKTDLPVLRKTETPQTRLRFTGAMETDIRKQIQWSAGKEGHTPLSLPQRAAITRARSQARGRFSFPGLSSSVPSTTLSQTNSRLPPPRLPASNRRTSSDNQSPAKTRNQATSPGARLGGENFGTQWKLS